MKIDLTCPVEVWRVDAPKTGYPSCELTLFNLSGQQVVSVEVTLILQDDQGAELTRINHRGHGLTGAPARTFTMTVPIEEPVNMSGYEVVVEKIWYDNSSVWRRGKEPQTEYTPNNLRRSAALSELREVAGEMAAGYPQMQGDLWLCVCGRPNRVSVSHCARCGRDKREVFERYSKEAVEAVIAAREKATDDKNRAAVAETSKMQEQREKEANRKRRRRTVVAGVIALVVVLAGGGYLTAFHILPQMKYNQAEEALAQGQYEQAAETFAALNDYQDAAVRVQESQFAQVKALLQPAEGNVTLEGIAQARRLLEGLGDYAGAAEQVQECDYQEALLRLADKEWDAADVLFAGLGEYRDSQEMRKEVAYQQLLSEMETTEDYEQLRAKWKVLDGYRDSATRHDQTWYLEAEDALERGDAVSALNCLSEIPDYEGTAALAQKAHYEYGKQLQAQGETTTAAEQFYEAKGYLDAEEQANESFYDPAVKALENGKYREAMRLLGNIRTYRDADDLWKQAAYQQVEAEMNALDFDAALEILAQLPEDYEDVANLKKDCVYRPAQIAHSRGEYEEAIKGFTAVAPYSESEKMIALCKYDWAAKKLQDGDWDGAIALYTELGDYEDSQKKLDEARTVKAEALASTGIMENLETAAQMYADLGDDQGLSATQYAQADLLLTQGQYAEAKVIFTALGNYQESPEKVKACDYGTAMALKDEGKLEEAAAILTEIADYTDAAEQLQVIRYQQAEDAAKNELPLAAAQYYAAAGNYQDAAQKATEQTNLYYGPIAQTAKDQFNQQQYAACADLLMGLDMTALPEGYADLADIFAESCYQAAEAFYAAGQPYAAYPYYQPIAQERRVKERLKESCYLILGNWVDKSGNAYAFRLDGTCLIAGEEMYFAVDGMTIRTGMTSNVLTDTHRLTGINTRTAWLFDQRSGTDVQVYLTKVEE